MTPRLVALALLVAYPAHALDCSTVRIEVGAVLSVDAAECLRREVVQLRHDAATSTARATEATARADACEATASILCPPPPDPVGPVVFAGVLGLLVGAVAGILLGIGGGR